MEGTGRERGEMLSILLSDPTPIRFRSDSDPTRFDSAQLDTIDTSQNFFYLFFTHVDTHRNTHGSYYLTREEDSEAGISNFDR